MFALFVNSIKDKIKHSELLIFLDDIKLFSVFPPLMFENLMLSLDGSVYDIAHKYSGDCVIDLGISFDRSLTFQTHIEKVTCKASKLLGFVKRMSAEFKFPVL